MSGVMRLRQGELPLLLCLDMHNQHHSACYAPQAPPACFSMLAAYVLTYYCVRVVASF
jgi:hypothetical protein